MEARLSLAKGTMMSALSAMMIFGSTFATSFSQWSSVWWTNRTSILMLTGVNTALTTVSEVASRSVLAHAKPKSAPKGAFFVKDASGKTSVHRQSIINIFMTIFASLLGGPIYFMGSRASRFLFFICFGVFNSALSQGLVFMLREGIIAMTARRMVFDLVYSGTFKFVMFEWGRPWILKLQRSIMGVGTVRTTQDFLTTYMRVSALNFFNIH